MANYAVDPAQLATLVPQGTQLDLFQGQALVSLVAFQFLDTRVWGVRIPWHVNFPEINLRFYLRRTVNGELRRGVAFVREIVPRRAIVAVANLLFNENYVARKMAHRVMSSGEQIKAEYKFWERGVEQVIRCVTGVTPQPLKPGSLEEFITEHYYGYTQGRKTREYRVEHPPWRTFPVHDYTITVDFGRVYGPPWAKLTGMQPHSVLFAEGSEVSVYSAKIVYNA